MKQSAFTDDPSLSYCIFLAKYVDLLNLKSKAWSKMKNDSSVSYFFHCVFSSNVKEAPLACLDEGNSFQQ